ncbi:MAG TPA: nickel-responsive transcriptional regulator NikR [Thermoproteota archaeon]|nr:nickel-responsive transcriptional regulator NikR [Thermoproteota archaeon]
MGTINISLPDEMVEELDGVIKAQHYASRSEIVRDALRTLFSEVEWSARLGKTTLAVVTMTFNLERRGVFEEINRLQHEYEDIVSTVLHNHLSEACLEVILTKGDVSRIRELAERLKAIRGIEVVRVTVA